MKHTNYIFITALILSLFVYVVFFPAPARAEFVDVPEGAWYTEAVNWCQKHGMINDGDAFFPQSVMTRAMVATALYRASGSPDVLVMSNFSDTSADTAISWAAEKGVITGYDDNTFRPDKPVTRQQFATMLWRSVGSPATNAETDYADEAMISSYAKAAVAWARDTGVILGKDGNRFDPHGGTTRAQAAVILYRFQKAVVLDDALLSLTINETSVEVEWEDNISVKALRELAAQNTISIQMSPYGGFEQVGSLGVNIPSDDRQITTEAGDIVLYNSSNIVLFYGSNSWSYTRLGKIHYHDVNEIYSILGGNGITLTLSMTDSA